MSAFVKFRDGALGPTVILLAICLVIVLALAATYQATLPVIERVDRELADAARGKVLPSGGEAGFTKIDTVLPAGVTEAYAADNGAGYVFQSSAQGFGGQVVFMIGMDPGGAVTGIELFAHEETPGLGTKVGAASYLEQFYGDADPNGVDAVAGATRTSNALKNSLLQAREAFEAVR